MINRLPMYLRARRGVGYLPQERCVFGRLTVRQNILAILEMQNLTRSARMARLDELLQELDLSHLAESKAQDLSGGETRRLEITRNTRCCSCGLMTILTKAITGAWQLISISVPDARHVPYPARLKTTFPPLVGTRYTAGAKCTGFGLTGTTRKKTAK